MINIGCFVRSKFDLKKFIIIGIASAQIFGILLNSTNQAYGASQIDNRSAVIIVQPGDTLWQLARDHYSDHAVLEAVSAISRVNDLGEYLFPGQKIFMPPELELKLDRDVSRGSTDRVLGCQATAYCYTGNPTATGTWPQSGRTIAVDPKLIPLNSRVQIICQSWPEINGVYIAEDTGGAVKGNIIDIYMDTEDEAIQWGRREVEVMLVQ